MQFIHRIAGRLGRHLLTGPIIYSVIVPIVILDLWIEVYHRICFPVYGIPYVKRKKYIRVDRQKIAYLTWIRKLHCMYCGYANGVLHYASVIAGETEKYWCGIMHNKKGGFVSPAHHKDFLPFNSKKAYDQFAKKK